ncbi:hypothetical protein JCM17823_05320 [Halorubrum gandharaense]
MNGGPRLLVVADDGSTGAPLASAVAERLPDAETHVTTVVEDARTTLVDRPVDCLVVVVADHEADAFTLVDDVRHRAPPLPVVVVGGDGATDRTAVQAFRADVDAYVPSDDDPRAAADRIADVLAEESTGRGDPERTDPVPEPSVAATGIATVEAIPDPFLAVSARGDLVEWNAAAEHFADDPERLDADGLDGMLASPEAGRFRQAVEGIAPGDTVGVVVEFDDPADGVIPHEFIGVCLERSDGGVAACGVARDVSVRRRREQVLHGLQRASRDLMAAETVTEVAERTVAAASDVLGRPQSGVHLLDESSATLRPVAVSETGRAALGEDVPSLGPGTLAWEAFQAGEVRRFADVRNGDTLENPETEIRSELIVPIGDHGVLIVSSNDPAEFTPFDETFSQTLASTAAAAIERSERTELLRQRERTLTERNETLDRFVATVSHDLRSPLTVASGRVELAAETGDTSHLEPAADALDRAEEIVDDLLTLVKQGESIGDVERVDVAMVARQAWTGVDTGDVELVVGDDVGAVQADPGRLRQLFENLYANAIEHNETIETVWVRREDGTLVVEDDGEGFEAGAVDKLFDAGFTTEEEGTGYGLSIVAEVANAHGWTVGADEGTETGGAQFVIDTDPPDGPVEAESADAEPGADSEENDAQPS